MDEIRKPRKRQRTFRRKSGSSLERVDSGVRVKSVRPNDFTRLQDTVLPLPNNNKVVIKYDEYELDFREVKIPYDVIIGRNSIIHYNLLRYDNDFLRMIRWRKSPYEKNLVKGNPTRVQPNHEHIEALDEPILAVLKELYGKAVLSTDLCETVTGRKPLNRHKSATLREPKNGTSGDMSNQVPIIGSDISLVELATLVETGCAKSVPKPDQPELNRAHQSQFIHYEETAEGDDFIGFEKIMNYRRETESSSGALVGRRGNNVEQVDTSNIPKNIVGTDEFKVLILALLMKYSDVFNRELHTNPADLPPMQLKVNESKWRVGTNARPPRGRSDEKQTETVKQVKTNRNSD